jgi:hypothetical protein
MKKSKAGRPRIELDERQIKELSSLGCSMTEIACVMGVHIDTIRDNYSKAIDEGRENGKISLRRAQWKLALSGNAQMLIWLGRFVLQQREEMSFSSSEPEVRALLEHWEVSAKKKTTFDKAKDQREQKIVAIDG